jgi:hypothetical protein
MDFRLDHLWWLGFLVTPFLAALSIAPIWWILPHVLSDDPSLEQDNEMMAFLAIYLVLCLGALTIFTLVSSIRSMQRTSLRHSIFHGNALGAGVANLLIDAPDGAELPLTLGWRPRRPGIKLSAIFLISVYIPKAFADLLPEFSSVPLGTDQSVWQQRADAMVRISAAILAFAAVLLYFYLRRRRVIVTADDTGVTRQSIFGIRRTVRWEDGRFLEIAAVTGHRTFVLWGTHSHVWWDEILHRQGSDLIPDGSSFEESEARARQLVSIVVARTGLLPRTFNRSLLAPEGMACATE